MDNSTQSKQDNLAKAREVAKANKEAKLAQEVEVETTKKSKQPVVETKHPVTDFEIDPELDYEFTRLDGFENQKLIPTSATVWDEFYQKRRQIRYCPSEESPYLDEQDELAKLGVSIQFRGKSMSVNGKEANKIKYLLAYDGNVDKKVILDENQILKGLYKMRDVGAEQKLIQEKEEQILEAKLIVKGATEDELDTFLRAQLGKPTDQEYLKSKAYELAGIIPLEFIGKFNNPINKIKAEYQKLREKGLVQEENNQVILTSTKAPIFTFEASKSYRVDTEIAKFILTNSTEAKTLKTILGL